MKNTLAQWMGLLVGLFGSLSYADSQTSVGINIQDIQRKIDQEHAGWHAKSSWVTKLSKSELKRILGLRGLPAGRLDFEKSSFDLMQGPTSLDWRNKDGVNWLGPVMNQGNCGSCVAFSAVATLEGQVSITSGIPGLRPSYSPQELFSCGGGGCDTGWRPDEAANFLEDSGVPDEACMPYTSGSTGMDQECSQRCSDFDQRSLKIIRFSKPTKWGGSIDAVKAALKRGPLVTTLSVYEDFTAYAGGVYKHVAGALAGGHAISIVGYDDAKRAWLIRNSWGTEWGEQGFGWVSWDDISGVGSETWQFEVPSAQDHYVAVTYPMDRSYLSGMVTITGQGKGLSGENLHIVINDGAGKNVTSGPMVCNVLNDQDCSASFNTTALKEGRYEMYIEGSNSLKSQVREFFVINSEPQMSLSFSPASGVNLSAPLSGRPEFEIKANFSPVPIEHVELRVLDQGGKIVSLKGNDYVLPLMKMGWRTITVPNGKYTILMHGETHYKGKVYAVDSNSFAITVRNKK